MSRPSTPGRSGASSMPLAPVPEWAGGWADIVRLVRRHFGAGDDAEDHVQDAVVCFLEQPEATVRNPPGFLRRVAGRLVLSAHRQRSGRSRLLDDPSVAARLSPMALDLDELVAARERLTAVEAAIGELPERARVVFLLHRIDGLSYTEIALTLGVSSSAVEKSMARALAHLAIRIQGIGHGERDAGRRPARDR